MSESEYGPLQHEGQRNSTPVDEAQEQAESLGLAPNHRPWRDVLPIHPAANAWELLPTDKLQQLADSIDKNGLRVPITIWYPGKTIKRYGFEEFDDCFLLDGRNRLDAIEFLFREGRITGYWDSRFNNNSEDGQDGEGDSPKRLASRTIRRLAGSEGRWN